MPPTLTAKSLSDTPDIKAPRFSIITKAIGGETIDGRRRFKATASSTITDRAGDEITLGALEQMADNFRAGLTIFMDHDNKVENAFGTTDRAHIVQRGQDPKSGQPIYDLDIEGIVNEPSERAVRLHESIEGGFVKFGASIDAFVRDHTRKGNGGMKIDGIDVYAASIVGVPMNQRTWTQKAVRAIKSFYGEPEEEDIVTKELESPGTGTPNEGVEVPLGATATLTVNPDGSSEVIVEKAADATVGETEDQPEVIEKGACPSCGKGMTAGEGCPDTYHSPATEKAATTTETIIADAQDSLGDTPETASAETGAETDTVEELKVATVSTDDVSALVKHVSLLVQKVAELSAENADLKAQLATSNTARDEAQSEVSIAKSVIEKVLQQPLRPQAQGYIEDFVSRFPGYDPEIAKALSRNQGEA